MLRLVWTCKGPIKLDRDDDGADCGRDWAERKAGSSKQAVQVGAMPLPIAVVRRNPRKQVRREIANAGRHGRSRPGPDGGERGAK